MTRQRHAELIALVDGIIHHGEDHVLLIDVGPAEHVDPRVVSLGKDIEPLVREPVII